MSNRKKICFIVSTSLTAKVFLSNHIQELLCISDVYLVGNFNYLDLQELKKMNLSGAQSIPIVRNISIMKDIIAIWKLYSYFRRMGFAVVHSVTPKAGLITSIAGWLARIENRIHIFTGQIWHTKKGFSRFFLKAIDRTIVFFSTQVLVDGVSQREYLIQNKILKNNYGVVLGNGSINGVDIDKLTPDISQKPKLREELGIDPEKIVFLYLGRINYEKGVMDLVKAFQMLREKNCNTFLLIVGFDEGNLIPIIEENLNKDDFLFYGPTNDPKKFYRLSDIFCLPSYREGFGTSVIEASSCELPIICSDTYGLKDTIVDGYTGLRHTVGNIFELSSQMEQLVKSQDIRIKMGLNGRHYVCDKFSSYIVTSEWLRFYSKLLSYDKT